MATSYIGRTDLPRGLRNNNPGNITIGDAWQGMIGDDGKFVIFADQVWGLRALATDLTNKIREGLNTITKIINAYAPASDNNNVPAYILAVSQDTGISPDELLSLDTVTLHDLVRAITTHENGEQYAAYIADSDIDAGIQLMNSTLLSLLQAGAVAVDQVVTEAPRTTWLWVGAGLVGLYLIFSKN